MEEEFCATHSLENRRINGGNSRIISFSTKNYIDRNFGLMTGDKSIEVCLQFSSKIADWVHEQVWHNAQEVFPNEDGSICLKFPVADFREIRREILKYGSKVEVLSPVDLREEIKSEIDKMNRIYK
jgi:predicted DNA-binding transcriptional regulator YafY